MVWETFHSSRARVISGESSSGVPSTVSWSRPKIGLAAEETRSLNQPFTACLAMQLTSVNPHPDPPSSPSSAGLRWPGFEGVGEVPGGGDGARGGDGGGDGEAAGGETDG